MTDLLLIITNHETISNLTFDNFLYDNYTCASLRSWTDQC